jgi:hypothetical protein
MLHKCKHCGDVPREFCEDCKIFNISFRSYEDINILCFLCDECEYLLKIKLNVLDCDDFLECLSDLLIGDCGECARDKNIDIDNGEILFHKN